ncbi:Phospholipid-transporting ATPase [Entamoeba marina]
MINEIELITNSNTDHDPSFDRILFVNSSQFSSKLFGPNKIITTKHSLLTVLPFTILEKCCTLYFIYFLIISILRFIPQLSNDSEPIMIGIAPFLLLFIIVITKECIEHLKGYLYDKKLNNTKVKAYRKLQWKDVSVKNICEGDIIRLEDGEQCPCDGILLYCDNKFCSVETSQLSGETTLHNKENISFITQETIDNISNFSCIVSFNQPTSNFNEFNGNFVIEENKSNLSIHNFITRGSIIRNPGFTYILSLYVGSETKYIQNCNRKWFKWSSMTKLINIFVLVCIIGVLLLSGITTLITALWTNSLPWYVSSSKSIGSVFFSTFIQYSNFVPISLFITLEIVRIIQSWFITHDGDMTSDGTISYSSNSSVIEDLGRVNYILTDKTGTLTQNKMQFKKCWISGKVYGTQLELDSYEELEEQQKITEPILSTEDNKEFNIVDFDITEIIDDIKTIPNKRNVIVEFFKTLALCNSIQINQIENELTYFGNSSDEITFVAASKHCGIELFQRTDDSISINVFNKQLSYRILNTLPFTSNRSRMSIIVYDGTDVFVYTKGSDTEMLGRLKQINAFEKNK